jgi:large subunit ribosomal protein L13
MAQKTYYPKPDEIERGWVLVDANGRTLGRLASRIAEILIGKNKPVYTPGVDVGDFVVVINAEAVTVTGNKLEDKKYYRHTGYPGGIRETSLKRMLERNPDRVLRAAVWGLVPHNRYGRALMKKLKIYAGPEHPHEAQQPQPLEL